jgi:hypothetical protein
MKFLFLPICLATLGAGWLGRASLDEAASPQPAQCDDCTVSVECTPHGTCIVTCTDSSGAEVCRREVPCDEDCRRACDRACEPSSSCSK